MLTAVAYLHPSSSIDPNSDKNGIHGSRNNNNNNISANNNDREGGAQLGSVRLSTSRAKPFLFLNFHGSSSWRSLPLSHCTNPVSDELSVSWPHISTSLSRLWVKIPSSRMSKREFSFADVQPSRVTKKTVSYCDTSDLELEFDEDGYERFKTKSFKNKANATNSNSDEFELGPYADVEDESITYVMLLSEMESEDEEMIRLKRKKNSNVVSLTHTVGTGAGVTFCCNVGFRFRMQDAAVNGNDGVRCTP
jgi:hypothetical protein